MKVITFGSKVLDDSVVLCNDISNEYRIVGVSPFSVKCKSFGTVEEITYFAKMFNLELNAGLESVFNNIEYEFCFIDFISAYTSLLEFCTEQGDVYFTNSQYLKNNKKTIDELGLGCGKLVDPLDFPENKIKQLVEQYYDYLKEIIDLSRIVLVEWTIPFQYIINSKLNNDDVKYINRINIFLEICQKYFTFLSNCKTIKMPGNIVRISKGVIGTDFDISKECKNYLADKMLEFSMGYTSDGSITPEERFENGLRGFITEFAYGTDIVLEDFVGYYTDCFDNSVSSQSQCNIHIMGIGNNVDVKKNIVSHSLDIYVKDKGSIKIGEDSTFAERCNLHADSKKITIGKDTMFSSFVECNACENDIYIGNHVWVGYQCKIISGAHINDGSVVGARSIVNTYVPNNCIVVGDEGRIIKKDIYWEREPFSEYSDYYEYAAYTNINDDMK